MQRLRPSGAPAGAAPGSARPSTVPARLIPDVLRGSGQPLAAPVKEEMQARLGADLSDVRVHTDGPARASAAEVGARAYTSGSHVVIGDRGADKHTLAHELTHVIQQRSGPVAGIDNGSGLRISDPSDEFERAAESNAHRVMFSAAPAHSGREAARTAEGPVAQRDVSVQRYEDFDVGGVTMRFSATGMYAFTVDDDPTLWVRAGAPVAPVLGTVGYLQSREMYGSVYAPHQIIRYVLNDCLHAAEEIINNQPGQLGEGGLHSRITVSSPGGGISQEQFGQSEQENIAQAVRYAGPRNRAANPRPGQAFVILARRTPRDRVMSPYHAAAVVGQDGNDRVTFEVWSAPGSDLASPQIYTVGDAQRSFHGHWSQAYFPGPSTWPLTVVLDPARPRDLAGAASPQFVNPAV